MDAYTLAVLIEKHPDAKIVILEGDDDHEHKKRMLSAYVSQDNEIVIQYWD